MTPPSSLVLGPRSPPGVGMLIKGSTFSDALHSRGREDLSYFGTIDKHFPDMQQPLCKVLLSLALASPLGMARTHQSLLLLILLLFTI